MYAVCAICKDSLSTTPPGSIYGCRVGGLACGHVFHVNCVNKWWNQQQREHLSSVNPRYQLPRIMIYQCPMCRQGNTQPQVIELFLDVEERQVENIAAADQKPQGNAAQAQQDREELQRLLDDISNLRLGRQEEEGQ